MNNSKNFLGKSINSVLFLFLILFLCYLFSIFSKIFFISILIGGFLATFNFLLGLIAIEIGITHSQDTFLKIVFGGMVLRLLLILSLVFISLKFLNISQNNFIFSILFFYVLYLIIEIIYLFMKKN